MIIGHMKKIAEDYFGKPIDKVALTVPPDFGDPQRKAMKEAATLAVPDDGLAERLEQAESRCEALRKALEEAIDYAYNPFEPENQSDHYKRMKATKDITEVE